MLVPLSSGPRQMPNKESSCYTILSSKLKYFLHRERGKDGTIHKANETLEAQEAQKVMIFLPQLHKE